MKFAFTFVACFAITLIFLSSINKVEANGYSDSQQQHGSKEIILPPFKPEVLKRINGLSDYLDKHQESRLDDSRVLDDMVFISKGMGLDDVADDLQSNDTNKRVLAERRLIQSVLGTTPNYERDVDQDHRFLVFIGYLAYLSGTEI
ncbi:hypothetical protein H4219_005013 [Mycoemilia scoparia]|uniref:Uncharacterized protein n=1 Tax=Mycoemilia scoparia TaxID=417184 RepID=A0A9W7ZXS2_9FUNG|nr:hypothetical protein H4219_005013 [Mycoemilia scoparia]